MTRGYTRIMTQRNAFHRPQIELYSRPHDRRGEPAARATSAWSLRRAVLVLLLALWSGAAVAADPPARLIVPDYPAQVAKGGVARLYRSAAYRVEVKPAGEARYRRAFAFETRNDWTYYDYFNRDPSKHGDVLIRADQVGIPPEMRGKRVLGKADLKTASFARFSFAGGPVDVRITLLPGTAPARSVTVRPLRFGIPTRIGQGGRTVEFTLDRPRKVSVEINDRLDPLFILADAPDVPDTRARYYFAPGVHRIPGNGTLRLESNDRVYIAAGAIVEGRFLLAPGSTNITIRGRGLLSGGPWPDMRFEPGDQYNVDHSAIWTDGSAHFLLEGITFVQSTNWQVAINDTSPHGTATHDNRYLNFSTISWNGCTDGIWVTGDRNRVDDVFIFNNDDFFVTKGGRDTLVTNAVLWGGTWGRMLLLHNIMPNTAPVDRLTFENIDVIGKEGAERMIYLEGWQDPKRPVIIKPTSNVTFRNLVIEERRRPGNSNTTDYNAARLFDIDTGKVRGAITNLVFENVVLGQLLDDEGWLLGTPDSPIKGVTFRNLRAGDKAINSLTDAHIRTNGSTSGVTFEP